ncbi:MAG: VanZ family protein [Acidobacteriota bacterium]
MDQRIDTARAAILTRLIWYWLPVAMMLGAMYYFSTDTFSDDNSLGVVEKMFLSFFPHASEYMMEVLNYVVRKSAHLTEYAILGALLFRAFRAGRPMRWRLKWAVYSFLSVASWALLDELHQTFTRTRSGSIWDFLLDSTGGLFSLAVIALYSIKHPTPRSS